MNEQLQYLSYVNGFCHVDLDFECDNLNFFGKRKTLANGKVANVENEDFYQNSLKGD